MSDDETRASGDDSERTESSPGGIGPSEVPAESVSSESELAMSTHIAQRDAEEAENEE